MTSVRRTPDLERVFALPRRELSMRDAIAQAGVFTADLAIERGAALLPWQGAALYELLACDGLVWFAPVGSGKTLFSFLAGAVLGARRPMLVVPASLKDKTYHDLGDTVGRWRTGAPITVTTYHDLQNKPDLLDRIQPDLIVADEADELSASRARRVDRYVRRTGFHFGGGRAPGSTRFAAITGTPSRHSIMDYWLILTLALGDGAPVPSRRREAVEWDSAMSARYVTRRVAPGALGRTQREAVALFRERLTTTQGVLVTDGDTCDQPLILRQRLARECDAINAAFERFQKAPFENPAGIEVTDPLSRWTLGGQLGCGLCQYYDPQPPDEWRTARREMAAVVRDAVDRTSFSDRPLDTEGQVFSAYADHPAIRRWLDVRDSFDADRATRVKWISDATLWSVRDWFRELDAPGIVWTGSKAFGPVVAQQLGVRYYAQRGQAADGTNLARAPVGQSLVASWNANKKGFNLQSWPRQLVVYPPQSAKWLEQLFGRSHRRGQSQPVEVTILITSGGTLDAFEAAVSEAATIRDRDALSQKILRAEIQRVTPRLTDANRYRWARKTEE